MLCCHCQFFNYTGSVNDPRWQTCPCSSFNLSRHSNCYLFKEDIMNQLNVLMVWWLQKQLNHNCSMSVHKLLSSFRDITETQKNSRHITIKPDLNSNHMFKQQRKKRDCHSKSYSFFVCALHHWRGSAPPIQIWGNTFHYFWPLLISTIFCICAKKKQQRINKERHRKTKRNKQIKEERK